MKNLLLTTALLLATNPLTMSASARADDGRTYALQVATDADAKQAARYAEYVTMRDNVGLRTPAYFACGVIATLYRPAQFQLDKPCTYIVPGEQQ